MLNQSFLSLNRLVLLSFAALVLVAGSAHGQDHVPTRYFDERAREIVRTLERGEGWAVVSARGKQTLLRDFKFDCVKYRVVTKYTSGTTSNNQDFVELTYGPETPWILVELFQLKGYMPVASCSSLELTKRANEAVGLLDEMQNAIAAIGNMNRTPESDAEFKKCVEFLLSQRAALVDLIQKDIESVGMSNGK